MAFDGIPEDREPSFPCPTGCGGDVTMDKNNGMMWQCNKCDWMSPQKESEGKE